MSITVFKVGGSLLTHPQTPGMLRQWVSEYERVAIVVGGGEIIDSIRNIDAVHEHEAATVHWLCVRMLRHTAELIAIWLPEATLIDSPAAWQAYQAERPEGIFIVVPELFHNPTTDDPLPRDWTTTSDSIAGLLCRILDSKHLILCKSLQVPIDTNLEDALELGWIDPVLGDVIDPAVRIEWRCPPSRRRRRSTG